MFRALLVSAALLLAVAPAAAQPAQAQPPVSAAAQADAAANVYVVSYRRGPRYDPAKGLLDQAAVKAHMDHIRSLGARVVAAAPVESPGDDQLGYVIFRAPDDAAAKAWLDSDPAVVAGSLAAKVHRWGVPWVRAWKRPAP